MAEARDFHCYSHVFENLEKETIPSDHAAVHLVIQKPTNRGHQRKRNPSWGCPNIPFSVPYCSSVMTTTDFLLTILCTGGISSSPTQGQEDDET